MQRLLLSKLPLTLACLLALGAVRVAADDLGASGAGLPPASVGPKSPAKPLAELTGREIYQRVLDNSFRSFIQDSMLTSGDRGGNEQESQFRMWFQSLRDKEADQESGTVVAKSMVKYTHPFDIRHSGYLVLNKLNQTNDQFVYMSSQRRVKRVNLRGEAVFGSDFSFEDILPREIEDADYQRLADTEIDGNPCFLVEAVPRPQADSEYSRMQVYIHRDRYVPLLTRYWDDRKVEVKELKADSAKVEEIAGVWIAKELTMRHLRLESYTTLQVKNLKPNPKLPRTTFELRRLEASH